jgi:hypothetical protein
MKTPLQELMQWFNERPQYDKTSEGYEIMQKAQELLAKEKEQITEAHCAGWGHAYDYYVTEADSYNSEPIQAEDYYNETYTNEPTI